MDSHIIPTVCPSTVSLVFDAIFDGQKTYTSEGDSPDFWRPVSGGESEMLVVVWGV